MASIYDWSLIAADNATADSGINWAEGQAPSTVNDSARVMMSRVKALLDDLGGVQAATGSANAIALSAASGFTAIASGLRVSFRATNTNSGTATLNVNSTGARPIAKITAYGEAVLAGGEIRSAGIYEAVYCTHLNGGDGAWLLLNPSNIEVTPPGTGAPYFGGTVPAGWLLCNGAAVSRTTYARLFTAIGTVWGAGNGSTTFNLPDGRDEFLRGASSTRSLGVKEDDAIRAHTHAGTIAPHAHSVPSRIRNLDTSIGGPSGAQASTNANSFSGTSADAMTTGSTGLSFTTDPTGGTETRPRNLVIHWIIKT